MIESTIPMVKVQLGKMLTDHYSGQRVEKLQAELLKVAKETPELYIPWVVTVGRKQRSD